jgi:nucleoside-diphosphate-sugar epimerase
MNVLITGNISSLASSLAKRFAKDKNKVILAGSSTGNVNVDSFVIKHSIDPSEALFSDALSAYQFTIVIYVASREEQLMGQPTQDSGKMLDGLLNTLSLSKKENVKKFYYISSTEIYGDMEDSSENIKPQPATPNGFILEAGEQLCKYYYDYFGIEVIIVRVPNIYGADEKNSLLYKIIQSCRNGNEVILPADEDDVCDFLHSEDVADFISKSLEENYYPKSGIVNLSSPDSLTFSELADLLTPYFPKVHFQFDPRKVIYTRPVTVQEAKRSFNWNAAHKLKTEMLSIVKSASTEPVVKKNLLTNITKRLNKHSKLLKWGELFLLAVVMQLLSNLSGTTAQFKYIDFRLLFVVIMGILYGTQFGLIASIMACLSLVYSWYLLSIDVNALIHDAAYWLPFAVYLTAGIVTGYLFDKKENDVKFQNDHYVLLRDKYTFLYEVYDEIRQIKDQFREQIMGYRDSFGRIYTIARELDTFQEEEILLRALKILENVMSNKSIALYSITSQNEYARLEINSFALYGQVTKSIKLSDFPKLVESLEKGEIFQNLNLEPNYPAYFVPIKNGNVPVTAVVIWSAHFEQYSLYYYNLLKVICGLIQSSLIRATLFEKVNSDKVFVPSTRILQPEAFQKVLKGKAEMKRNQNADYQLILVDGYKSQKVQPNWPEIYTSISREIRTVDVMGLKNDYSCYVLLSQAHLSNVDNILARLEKNGIKAKIVNDTVTPHAE